METFRQFGYLGAGLGTATQGVRHLLGTDLNIGWQEGGLGKLAIEVGLPGILALVAVAAILARLLLLLTRIPDVEGSSQFLRVMLFALVAANGANFIASAQAYSDAVLALMTGFFAGCLFATAALDERLLASRAAAAAPARQLTAPAPA
jgi:chromate transport protein ChrA